MAGKRDFKNKGGFTIVELLIVIAIIGILAVIGVPEINRFSADYKVRTCATDLIQNMKVARAMAIKENREYIVVFDTANNRYLIGFDGDVVQDNNLITTNSDTFGICKDIDNDRLPEGDVPHSAPNADIPECVKVINLSNCGNSVVFGFPGSTPIGPGGTTVPASGENFNSSVADFNPDGSAGNIGSVYFQHTERGYSYCARVSNSAAAMNMWKWNGDIDNLGVTTWTELR